MANNFDEKRVQEIVGILKPIQAESMTENSSNDGNKSFNEDNVQKAMQVLRGTSEPEKRPEKEFNLKRFLGEKFFEGALNLADLPQTLIQSTGNPNLSLPEREWTREEIADFSKNQPKPIVSSAVESVANKVGVDLHSQGEGNTATQRILGEGAKFAGGSLLPGGGLPGFVKNVATGATVGAGAGALEELGTPGPIAALASLGAVLKGAPALLNAIKGAINKVPNLSDAEKRVANYLQQALGEEGVATINENIAEAPKFPLTGYEQTTAEVANNPVTSTLHRLRQGIAGTGLQERAGLQNEAIHNTAEKLSLDAMKSSELKDTIKGELSAKKAKLHSETEPLYTELRKDETQVNPKNINKFIKDNKIVKGNKQKDLKMVKKLLKPSKELSEAEEIALRNYKSQVKGIKELNLSEEAEKIAISKLEKPNMNYPTVADLDEARQNINDKIGKFKGKQNNRARQLIEAKKALDKDLAPFHLQKEATAKYAELSKPVNEILEHPTLKNIPESRLNEIFDTLFNNRSTDNFKGLKQVLKDKPTEWKGIQDKAVDYLMKSIRNAGAEGRKNVLSYHKLDKFIEKHGEALKEVFTTDQLKFLDELQSALKGRNVAETLGAEKQSATYGKLITGTNLSEGFGRRLLNSATYAPHVIPKVGKPIGEALRTLLGGYFKTREGDVMSVLDNFLKNPEYASKLLNHKFSSQADFNKMMDSLIKQSPSIIANEKDNK